MSSEDINHFCCMTSSHNQATVWIRLASRVPNPLLKSEGQLSVWLRLEQDDFEGLPSSTCYMPLTLPTQWFIRYLKSSRKPKREFSRNACDEQSKEEFSFWERALRHQHQGSEKYFWNTRTTSCWFDLVSVSRSQYFTLPLVLINFKVGAKKVRSPYRSLLALSTIARKKVEVEKGKLTYPWLATFHAFAKQQHLLHRQETLPIINTTWDSRNSYAHT